MVRQELAKFEECITRDLFNRAGLVFSRSNSLELLQTEKVGYTSENLGQVLTVVPGIQVQILFPNSKGSQVDNRYPSKDLVFRGAKTTHFMGVFSQTVISFLPFEDGESPVYCPSFNERNVAT